MGTFSRILTSDLSPALILQTHLWSCEDPTECPCVSPGGAELHATSLSMEPVFTRLFLMLLRSGEGFQACRQSSTSFNTSSWKGPDL